MEVYETDQSCSYIVLALDIMIGNLWLFLDRISLLELDALLHCKEGIFITLIEIVSKSRVGVSVGPGAGRVRLAGPFPLTLGPIKVQGSRNLKGLFKSR